MQWLLSRLEGCTPDTAATVTEIREDEKAGFVVQFRLPFGIKGFLHPEEQDENVHS